MLDKENVSDSYDDLPEDEEVSLYSDAEEKEEASKEKQPVNRVKSVGSGLTVFVNDAPVVLSGKDDYVFVDVFDFIDFDLSKPQGKSVVTIHNGKPAQYMDPLNEGDRLEICWKD